MAKSRPFPMPADIRVNESLGDYYNRKQREMDAAAPQAPSGQQAEPTGSFEQSEAEAKRLEDIAGKYASRTEFGEVIFPQQNWMMFVADAATRSALAGQQSEPTTGQILALERRSDMSDDEAIRYARSVLWLRERLAGQQSERPQSDLIRPPRQGQPSGATSGVTPERGGADHPFERPAPAGQAVDAERYRWLCRAPIVACPSLWDRGVGFACDLPGLPKSGASTKQALDTAIDAALASSQAERPAGKKR